ncbi:AvrD family protein [Streptomyces sp. NPDC001970]
MHSKLSPDTLRVASVDDILGDRRNRFFGEGFKRVTHALTGVTVRPADAGATARIDATAGIRIPGTWSRKGDTHQRPHLSTVDAMLFGAQLSGLYAAHTHDLSADAPFVVRSLAIKAGAAPDEDSLDHFAVSGTHHATAEGSVPGRLRTALDCQVGSMTVRVEAEHSGAAGTPCAEGSYPMAEQRPGPWCDAPYGASHHSRRQFLTDVRADAHTASAALTVTTGEDAEGATLPPTMIDLFVSALQLGQVLLYRLDGVDRATSNTLWMRNTTIAPATTEPAEDDGRFHVTLARPTKLPTRQGTWRTAQITTTYAGMRLTCNVAHLLP